MQKVNSGNTKLMDDLILITLTSLDPILGLLGGIINFHSNFNRTFLYARSENHDQTPRDVVSDLGLHCLLLTNKADAYRIFEHLYSFYWGTTYLRVLSKL